MNKNKNYVTGFILGGLTAIFLVLAIFTIINTESKPEISATRSTLVTVEAGFEIDEPTAPTIGNIELPKKKTPTVQNQSFLPVNNTVIEEESQVEYSPAPVSTPVEEVETPVDYINSGNDDKNILSEAHKDMIEGEMNGECPTSNLECGMSSNPGSDHNTNPNVYGV